MIAINAHQKSLARKDGPDSTVAFIARVAGYVIAFNQAPILEAVSRGDWLDALPFAHVELREQLAPLLAKNTKSVTQLSAQAMFVQYFDSIEDEARPRHSDPLVRFGKAIRNAGAHGQAFVGLDDRAGLEWKGLKLAAADNGKTLLDVGLNPGDLIVLMSR